MTSDAASRHVVITGPMGVGKSTTARAVAEALGRPTRDSDLDLERTFGSTGADIAATDGVAHLHRLEAAVLIGQLAQTEPLVISAAASVVTDAACRQALARRAFTVVLIAPPERLVERARSGAHRRPISAEDYGRQLIERGPLLDQVADVTIDATQPADQVAALALDAFRALPA